jgi:tRNA 2-thiouridine synthesizing protein E
MTTVLENISLNDEGFMTDPNEWTQEIAEAIARQEGIEELKGDHWKIIDFCRETGLESGSAPTLRQITTGTNVTTKELFKLFPKGPAKKVAKISGLGKPEGCV